MDQQLIIWALTAAVTALAVVLWYLGRQTIARLDAGMAAMTNLEVSVNHSLSELRISVAMDMGGIRERLARLEGHAGIGK